MQKINRYKVKYEEVRKTLSKDLKIKNKFAVPGLEKVVVNMGIGALNKNEAGIEALRKDIGAITGQMPSIRKAKVSIASFNLREGMPVGLSVTLRSNKMY